MPIPDPVIYPEKNSEITLEQTPVEHFHFIGQILHRLA